MPRKAVAISEPYIGFYCPLEIACEQALCQCLGKNSEEREGKGGERACRETFEAAIPLSCNYPAGHLSGQSISRVSNSWEN